MLNGSSHRCLAERSLAKREAFSLRFLSLRFLAHSSPTRQWLGGLVAPFESADLPRLTRDVATMLPARFDDRDLWLTRSLPLAETRGNFCGLSSP
jgi:hypothetical protein